MKPLNSLSMRTRARMPVLADAGLESDRPLVLVLVLVCEAALLLAPQPASQTQTARLESARGARIWGGWLLCQLGGAPR